MRAAAAPSGVTSAFKKASQRRQILITSVPVKRKFFQANGFIMSAG